MKRCSISVLTRKMQIKIIKYILLSKLVKIRKAGKGRSTVLCHWWKRSQETVTVKALRMFKNSFIKD